MLAAPSDEVIGLATAAFGVVSVGCGLLGAKLATNSRPLVRAFMAFPLLLVALACALPVPLGLLLLWDRRPSGALGASEWRSPGAQALLGGSVATLLAFSALFYHRRRQRLTPPRDDPRWQSSSEPQRVGLVCGACDRRIVFEDDATDCPECRRPHHPACLSAHVVEHAKLPRGPFRERS